jgi:uncharacterized protein YkwD/uncharacterized membrane protein required for colicin V production
VSDVELNPVDLGVLAIVVLAAWYGFRAGFVNSVYGLASWILAIAAGFAFQGPAARAIEAVTALPQPVVATVGFVAVIIAVEALFSLIGYLSIRPLAGIVRRGRLGAADRALGTIPAAIRSVLVVAIVVLAIAALPLDSGIKAAVETSRTGRIVNDRVAEYQPQISALTAQLGGSPLLVTKIGEDETEQLTLPDDLELVADPVAERQLFELVNEERVQRGGSPLAWDDRLVPVARAHSEEMFELKYFSHDSPVTGSPFDRLRAGRVTYSRAGENLAYAQSVAVAHRGLMDSAGHRENILRPEFTRVGIGVINAGPYGRMFTQIFITP